MAQVRIIKNFGFEQPGEIVDYRNVDMDDRLLAGDIELITADPRSAIEEPVVEKVEKPVTKKVTTKTTSEVNPVEEVTEEPVVAEIEGE